VRTWFLAALMLALAACAGALKKPEISLADFQVVGGNLFEQRFHLTLRVRNPNARELALEKLNFDMLLGEHRFASGMATAPVTVPPSGEALVEVDGTANLVGLLGQASSQIDAAGKLHFRLRGQAEIGGYGMVPFDHPAELDASRLTRHRAKD
jgi:LEA14-like dessication related protein